MHNDIMINRIAKVIGTHANENNIPIQVSEHILSINLYLQIMLQKLSSISLQPHGRALPNDISANYIVQLKLVPGLMCHHEVNVLVNTTNVHPIP